MAEQSYNDAKESCKTKFGNNQLGRLFEPKTLESSQEITTAAKIRKSHMWKNKKIHKVKGCSCLIISLLLAGNVRVFH